MGKRERRRRRERLNQPQPAAPQPRTTNHLVTASLQQLAELRRTTEIAIDEEIDRLLSIGVRWPVIAAALGVSRQAARQRWLRRQS